ncbi:MAG: tRNA (adenosine(37)-N6)-threonylcarbamoyltransferase complex ATPase subunit type 1 TsaE [Candidatus Omnitrophica bacterium]|nr:tRNA (adenosine(37)-N6)-threonylcarbamoyltransferase complex ATPase subunit type 1 TsaE [Candidatus Omnitrophota bacterium]
MTFKTKTITYSPEETMSFAESIVGILERGDLIALIGDLGAGKTMFVKGLAKGLGVQDHLYVNSPSFVIMKEYRGEKKLYHFDVYRLEEKSFVETLDYEKYFYGNGITVIEWANKIKNILPEKYLEVKIEYRGLAEREIMIRKIGQK